LFSCLPTQREEELIQSVDGDVRPGTRSKSSMEEQQGMAAAEQQGMAETDRWSRGVCFGGGANPR
jgi:hypothetical protein